MNWDNKLSSILSEADGSVAKMRERLGPYGKTSKEDPFPLTGSAFDSDLNLRPARDIHHHQPSQSVSSGVQWADLAAFQSQLQIQRQVIESLKQKLQDMESEKQCQDCHIQSLHDEVRRLREDLIERDRKQEDQIREQSPRVEQRMEQWRREVGREISSLRGQIIRVTTKDDLEESFSSKLRREELENLRMETNQLKTRLRRQEEDMFLLQTESRETRLQYQRSCKTLEELIGNYRSHSAELLKTISEHSHTQHEVHQIKKSVSELKDEVRSLILRRNEPTALLTSQTPDVSPLTSPRREARELSAEEANLESEFSPTPSLAEISSDDFSWLDDRHTGLDQVQQRRPRVRYTSRDFVDPGSGLEPDDNDDPLLDDEDDDDFVDPGSRLELDDNDDPLLDDDDDDNHELESDSL